MTTNDSPSKKSHWKAITVAVAVSGLLFVTLVLPAEFGKDPTGFGALIGLKKMGETKQSMQQAKSADQAQTAKAATVPANGVSPEAGPSTGIVSSAKLRQDEMTVVLAPNKGTEIKVTLTQGSKVQYRWVSTDKTNFDAHGDSAELKIDYHCYKKGADTKDEGTLSAAFTGNHGWYWKNKTAQPIKIVLTVSGEYSDIKHME